MRRPTIPTVLFAAALALTGCGGDDTSEDTAAGDTPVEDGADDVPADEPADADQVDDDAPAEDEGLGVPINPGVLDIADDVVEIDTDDGGRVVAAMTCNDGQTILQAGFAGFPNGIYEGVIDPSAGGDLTAAIQGDGGTGLAARQGSFDEAPEYTVTYEELGVEFTIDGCPAP